MKNLVLALSLTLASSVALAQPESGTQGGHKGGQKGFPLVRMQNELGLTDEQLGKMREIRDAGGTREEIGAVLTPEQRDKAAELKQAHQGNSEARLSRMKTHLDLSDEQAEKIEKIMEEGGSRHEIYEVMTPEQKTKLDQARGHRKGQRQRPPESAPGI